MPGKGYQQPTETRSTERLQARTARRLSGRIDWEDVDMVRSAFGPFTDPRILFDGDEEKGILLPAGVPPPYTIYFDKPQFIGHQNVMTTDPTRFDTALGAVITFIGADGAVIPPGVGTVVDANRAHIAPPVATVPIIGITIAMGPGLALPFSVSEQVIEVCQCVTASVTIGPINIDNSPDEPIFSQMQQQLVNEEVNITTALAGTPTNIMDKDRTTSIVGTGLTTAALTHPKQADHISIMGNLVDVDVDIVTIDGTIINIVTGVTDGDGWDSGNFTPQMITEVRVTANGPGDSTIIELVVLKVIPTKAARNLNLVDPDTVISAMVVANASPVSGTPAGGVITATGQPPAASGIRIEKDNNFAINAEVAITADVGIALINANLDWFYSEDDITYYYMATTALDDTSGAVGGNPNPTGFAAAGGISTRNIAQPLTGIGRYLQVVVRNDDANPITATVTLVRQR